MMNLVNIFEANRSDFPAQKASFAARGYSWRAAFLVTYAVEFLCMCAAKLMVLDRMSLFAAPQGARLPKQWAAPGRTVMAAVVLGNAVGLAANAAAAVHYHEAAAAARAEAAYYTVDSIKAAMPWMRFYRAKSRCAAAAPSHPCSCSARLPSSSSLSPRLLR
jgi:hypothetical protein